MEPGDGVCWKQYVIAVSNYDVHTAVGLCDTWAQNCNNAKNAQIMKRQLIELDPTANELILTKTVTDEQLKEDGNIKDAA